MKILGLDIASTTGWAVLEDDKLIDRGLIILDSKMDLSQKLRYFSIELFRVFEKYKVEWAFIEDVFLGISGAKTLAYLARLNGICLNVAFTYVKDNVKLFQPPYWKSNSFPELRGFATKWEVQLAAVKFFKMKLDVSFYKSFMEKQQNYYIEIDKIKNDLESKKKLISKYKADLNRKRNPLSSENQESFKKLIELETKYVLELKNGIIYTEKQLNKFMDKISIDITTQTGISQDIGDAIAIAVCGMREIKK
jgi:Holliday junction resolvasome RuvABC endonuclease subunit